MNLISRAQPTNSFPLWPDGAPGALGKTDKDIPTLTPFFPKPENATGAAMIICPGGGYGGLADHEGKDYALWLADHGIAGFVLKYRLGSAGYRHPIMLQDVSHAVRLVRAKSSEWKLDSKKIGLMGSSAGGHLASTLLTHFDSGKADSENLIERQSSRPDLGILCYPVITMTEKTHAGSKKNLLGENPSAKLIEELSNELHVTKETPPCFLFHSAEDNAVPVENSLMFASALRNAGVPFDLHIYEKGPHGMGLGFKVYATYEPDKIHPWTKDCLFWLRQHQFVK
ncbi:MAG: alpha/beta hydrolase [Limisphaerales bacterium]